MKLMKRMSMFWIVLLVFGISHGALAAEVEDYSSTIKVFRDFPAVTKFFNNAYGYAVFLMNDEAVEYLEESDGWEIGVGPTVVLVNAGVAENLSTSTLKEDAYAFVFDQKGLMAGISIEGTKITKLH